MDAGWGHLLEEYEPSEPDPQFTGFQSPVSPMISHSSMNVQHDVMLSAGRNVLSCLPPYHREEPDSWVAMARETSLHLTPRAIWLIHGGY